MMTQTMKAAVVRGFGKPLAIEEIPIPTPGPGEVLVKVVPAASAIPTFTRPTGTGPRSQDRPLSPVTRAPASWPRRGPA
jgi:propanol-preferring alcohol dehydrogenase